jgi:hypothetical protein
LQALEEAFEFSFTFDGFGAFVRADVEWSVGAGRLIVRNQDCPSTIGWNTDFLHQHKLDGAKIGGTFLEAVLPTLTRTRGNTTFVAL